MKISSSLLLFVIVEILVVAFILSTVGRLPLNIASHFDAAGMPNGFMSQAGYIDFMLIFAVGIPSLIVFAMTITLSLATNFINVPNRDYWLAPERKGDTVQFLKMHSACLGMMISLFIVWIHWLLIKANSVQPPQLPNDIFLLGMGVFILSMLLWGLWLIFKFRRSA